MGAGMGEIDSTYIIQIIGASTLAIITLAVGLQKLLKSWKATDAESSVITLMHTELERMSAQNTALSEELGRLHLEILNLNKQIRELSLENRGLQHEIVSLNLKLKDILEISGKVN